MLGRLLVDRCLAVSVDSDLVWGSFEGGRRLSRFAFPTVFALGASIFALSQGPTLSQARATTAKPAAVGQDAPKPYLVEPSLALTLPAHLEIGRLAAVQIDGYANAGDELSAFIDPKGAECPLTASARPERAISLASATVDEGPFRVKEAFRPIGLGTRSFCAYLEGSLGQTALQAIKEVIPRRLRESAAEHAVVTALKRHGFASRAVKSVRQKCRRRSRNGFTCKFSGGFPGYKLKGSGKVKLGLDLSYRFRVKAQGVRLSLTDDNEEPRSN